jgi:hypothetical protein
MGGRLLLTLRGVVDWDLGGNPFFSLRASRRKSDFGSILSPPEVEGRCEGVIDERRGKTGYWFGVKYFGVVFVLAILKMCRGKNRKSGNDVQRNSLIQAATLDLSRGCRNGNFLSRGGYPDKSVCRSRATQ